MRAFASFLGSFPIDGTPPGHEVAVAVSALLEAAGEPHTGPAETHAVAWLLEHELEGGRVACVVKLADAPGGERWLVEVSIRKRGRQRFASKGAEDHAAALRAWCIVLHEGLKGDGRVDDVRWATPEAWW